MKVTFLIIVFAISCLVGCSSTQKTAHQYSVYEGLIVLTYGETSQHTEIIKTSILLDKNNGKTWYLWTARKDGGIVFRWSPISKSASVLPIPEQQGAGYRKGPGKNLEKDSP